MNLPSAETCHYCGLTDDRVEAGGVYHCPNPICPGCGAAYWRKELCKSYKDLPNGNHTVDSEELAAIGDWLLEGLPLGHKYRYAVLESMHRFRA